MRERAYQERIKLLQLEKDREAHEAQERKVREEQAEEMKRRQVVEILAAKLDVAAHTAKEKVIIDNPIYIISGCSGISLSFSPLYPRL